MLSYYCCCYLDALDDAFAVAVEDEEVVQAFFFVSHLDRLDEREDMMNVVVAAVADDGNGGVDVS
jgi:hypothetical protein